MQELIGHYQINSLRSAIPEISTTLRYSYYKIVSPPRRKIALPFLISSDTSPTDIEALDLSNGSSIESCNEVRKYAYVYIFYDYILSQV